MAKDHGIAVLFPDVGEPYRGVFEQIIKGIEDKSKVRVTNIPLRANADAAELGAELNRQDIRVVIALGKPGVHVAAGLGRNFDIVAGAVLSASELGVGSNTVYSLAPDPALLLSRLKALHPGVRRVSVVYNPLANEWLIQLARQAATSQGIELNALPAGDLKAAVKQYQEFFAASTKADALWLPQDSMTVEESIIVPLVLKETWNRGLPLLSSSLAHVRRGALFSLYPNHQELGKELATSAQARLGSGSKPDKGLLPLRAVMSAVNTRTANHLGIHLRQQDFDLLLPEH